MTRASQFLLDNPLLLFVVVAIGYPLGCLKIRAGATMTFATALWVGYRRLKIPMGLLDGLVAGVQTQPAVLGFALEQSGDDRPNVGYAAICPLAMIVKIALAQVLVVLLL
jgi:putative transport protein